MPHLHNTMRRLNKDKKKVFVPTSMQPYFYSMPPLLSVSPADRGLSHSQQRPPLLTHDHQDGVNSHSPSTAFMNGIQSQSEISSISRDNNSCATNSTDSLLVAAAMPLRAGNGNGKGKGNNINNESLIGSTSLQPAPPSQPYSGGVSPLPNSRSNDVTQSLPSSKQNLLLLLLQQRVQESHQKQLQEKVLLQQLRQIQSTTSSQHQQQLQLRQEQQLQQLRQIQSITSSDFNTKTLLQRHIMNRSGIPNHATSSMNSQQLQNLNDVLSNSRYYSTNNGAHNGNRTMNYNSARSSDINNGVHNSNYNSIYHQGGATSRMQRSDDSLSLLIRVQHQLALSARGDSNRNQSR